MIIRLSVRSLSLLVVAVSIGLAGCGPFLLLPGGKLDGSTLATPSDWTVLKDVTTIQLETRPSDPYSVNIWAVGIGPNLYVSAGANRSAWVVNIEANPEVRVRLEDDLYELVASRVERPDEFKSVTDAYDEKYGNRERTETVEEVYVFRLDAR
jgi:hypothetical protein